MEGATIREVFRETHKYLNKEVEVQGWIRTIRSLKKLGFIEINDGTFFNNVQIVFDESLDNFKEIGKLPISTALVVKGILEPTPEAKQPFEIKATDIEVGATSEVDYPLQKK